ncbi:MAG: alanine racemase [Lachnospiraceae bacterium]
MNSYDRVYAEINLDAIWRNMRAMQNQLAPNTKMCGVIKTDGYGHGAVPVARTIDEFVWGYAVASMDEALNLRENRIEKPILVLGSVFPVRYREAIEQDIRLSVFQKERILQLNREAAEFGKKARIHVAIDTGMGRIGIPANEKTVALIKEISQYEFIEIEGIFTHMARADEIDKTNANQQISKFKWLLTRLEEEGISIPIRHCSNSAGIIDLPQAQIDMVRAGISIYGLYPSEEVDKKQVILEPAMAIRSFVTYIKEMEEGSPISYGGTYVTSRKEKIAVISVGYGDGYPRKLSNQGYVLIHGQKAPIRGRVCMDQFMVDVSNIPDVKEGDVVTLVGRDGANEITVEELADMAGSFNYEFICDVGKRIPRVYYQKGKAIGMRDWFHEKIEFI